MAGACSSFSSPAFSASVFRRRSRRRYTRSASCCCFCSSSSSASTTSAALLGANASETTRVLAWGACLNVRDLGGLTTADGRRVRRGARARSDQLCRLNHDGRAALLDHGVRTVIDLRNAAEAQRDADPTWHEQDVDYRLIPQQDDQLWQKPEW